ncbi:unnamed protein product [Ostreobium quekettii]|nr:unnamed protein product [Ostreobium quekettii]
MLGFSALLPGMPNKPFTCPPSLPLPSRQAIPTDQALQAIAASQAAQAAQLQAAQLQAAQLQAQLQAQAAQAGLDLTDSAGLEECMPDEFVSQAPDSAALGFMPSLQLSGADEGLRSQWAACVVQSAVKDPGKYLSHFQGLGFQDLFDAMKSHLWTSGPIPDMALFQLFRKVHNREQADRALALLNEDRATRVNRGMSSDYSEVTSSAVFCALNRAGEDDDVVAAAESASAMGLTLSRSSMYHLMKQYSVKGKVEHVEKLFRALETAGKSWNSNCIVIMMLAYFNQGRFEEADQLRKELQHRGIKLSERINARLDKLLSGEEYWRWEDKVYVRQRSGQAQPSVPQVPLSFGVLNHGNFDPPGLFSNPYSPTAHTQRQYHSAVVMTQAQDAEEQSFDTSESASAMDALLEGDGLKESATLLNALEEPKVHLSMLRLVGFDDLFKAIEDHMRLHGPVENVVISFLFRKVENRDQAERAMNLLAVERAARKEAGISDEYNETTCSRIFTALFRVGATDLALSSAESAASNGLILSGKALHELLKSFAISNQVDKVEEIWKLVKAHGKPSSRIVYSIFRTYFDNHMMDKAARFREEIREMGISLSASATRNIEEVLSGAKQWVKDPHAAANVGPDDTGDQLHLRG